MLEKHKKTSVATLVLILEIAENLSLVFLAV